MGTEEMNCSDNNIHRGVLGRSELTSGKHVEVDVFGVAGTGRSEIY
jgi:hypothetical protein